MSGRSAAPSDARSASRSAPSTGRMNQSLSTENSAVKILAGSTPWPATKRLIWSPSVTIASAPRYTVCRGGCESQPRKVTGCHQIVLQKTNGLRRALAIA